ncbi:MAG TPA: nucleotidyltransferase family protein [Candidatus Hodarchaeales archaeon]|nr:nucleotidyltransferase family protein [Candidatus Hodarchaeales archaeon]
MSEKPEISRNQSKRDKVLAILSRELPQLNKDFSVKSVGLFGSYARGTETAKSDIDILIEFERPVDFFLYIKLEDHLSTLLRKRVEIVTLAALKERIKDSVLREVVYA